MEAIRAEFARWAVLVVAVGAWGCGGDTSGAPAGSEEAANLPVRPPSGPVDEALAERGGRLFTSQGCVGCHTMGEGRRVGPDLEGVVERRSFPWIYHMVTNPDSMLRSDTTAGRLLGEYFTPMPDQNIDPEEFRAIYEFMRSEPEEGSGEGGHMKMHEQGDREK